MLIDRFSTLDQLVSIKSRWTELYENDGEASVFLSWDWITACFATESRSWVVLGVREGALPHVAFVPLTYTKSSLNGRVLSLGPGARADFTGMLGVPGEEERFIRALAQEIQRLPWDRLTLSNASDPRAELLAGELGRRGLRIVSGDPTPCPHVELPATWEEYLSGRGRSTRRTLRSHLNRIQALPDYRLDFTLTHAPEGAIDNLLHFHSLRWKKNLAKSNQPLRDFLVRCAASGRFVVASIYQGDKVIAVQGVFVEQQRRTIVAYMIAHNPEYAQYSPGVMLGCESIRYAIDQGYRHFSLSRGNQAYKMSLATDVRYLTNTTIWRKSIRAATIDGGQRTVAAAKTLVRRVLRFRSAGRPS